MAAEAEAVVEEVAAEAEAVVEEVAAEAEAVVEEVAEVAEVADLAVRADPTGWSGVGSWRSGWSMPREIFGGRRPTRPPRRPKPTAGGRHSRPAIFSGSRRRG
ncbi:hypothetical protein FF36_03407 [Frankia torreyi]|uniref:Uncharacterized protein n=1 Tax=Frankia torreyi TaxID=1856 RepID=A0A0D8BDK2_9ACTN|nr:hypothetical protein FF36_03407 [Frankia torreyi]